MKGTLGEKRRLTLLFPGGQEGQVPGKLLASFEVPIASKRVYVVLNPSQDGSPSYRAIVIPATRMPVGSMLVMNATSLPVVLKIEGSKPYPLRSRQSLVLKAQTPSVSQAVEILLPSEKVKGQWDPVFSSKWHLASEKREFCFLYPASKGRGWRGSHGAGRRGESRMASVGGGVSEIHKIFPLYLHGLGEGLASGLPTERWKGGFIFLFRPSHGPECPHQAKPESHDMKKTHRSITLLAAMALSLPVTGAVIVLDDDADRDFAAGPNVSTTAFSTDHNNGGWGSGPQYFNSTNAYNGGTVAPYNGGSPGPASAIYVFDGSMGIIAGATYNVYATWAQAGQGNTGPATYGVSDGLGDVVVNQTLAVASDILVPDPFVGDMKNFQLLGQIVDDGDGVITVTLTADGTNFVLADAVAVDLVPEPSSLALLGLGGLALLRRRR